MKWSFARLQLQEAEVTEASESLNTHLAIWCHLAILALLCQIIQWSKKLSGQVYRYLLCYKGFLLQINAEKSWKYLHKIWIKMYG